METNTDMLRGRVDIFVLKALSVHDGYGYDILNYVHDKTEGHYEMKQSSIYSVLKRLEKQGYISSYDGTESNGAKRRYYTLTDAGRQLLSAEEKEWEYTRTLLDNLVSDKTFDLMSDTPPFHPSDLRPLTRRTAKTDAETEDTSEEVTESPAAEPVASERPVVEEQTPTVNEINEIEAAATVTESSVSVGNSSVDSENTEIVTTETAVVNDDIDNNSIETVPDVTEQPSNDTVTFTPVQEQVRQKQETVKPIVEEPSIYEKIAMTTPNTYTKTNVRGDKYREFFGDLFTRNDKVEETAAVESVDIDCSHINDLRNHLDREGIKLRSYEPTNSGKGLVKYVLVNKLFRDTVTLSYLFLVAMLLVVYLCKPFGVSLTAFLTILCIGAIAPVAAALVWFKSKDAKKKDNFNTKIILAASGIIYLTFFVVNLIVNLIVPNGHSLNSLATYAPSIIFLVVPFFGATLCLLYRTKNYHLNTL